MSGSTKNIVKLFLCKFDQGVCGGLCGRVIRVWLFRMVGVVGVVGVVKVVRMVGEVRMVGVVRVVGVVRMVTLLAEHYFVQSSVGRLSSGDAQKSAT